MRKDHLSLLNGNVTRSEAIDRQPEFRRQGQTDISSVVWDRLVKDEGITQQPWHHRLQVIRFNQ
ncbi:hypothetical protein V4V36_18290 [Paenibacillus lautus]|uniref:hypothetical protein n=1 Tax=Paenibacillus lautus TaxID=1401 RepID=UPI0010ED1028|nr:hypothetical protein [Paenibacillus lautus]MCI1774651.1 hypothetical protein [Paenibacillus lautus]VTR37006.1 Uncharacterised protein [Actinobacillus pleuropneumoniae]